MISSCCFSLKALFERRFLELRDRAQRLEELLPRRVSSEEQREVLGLLCKVHELEIENAEMQSHALLKDNVIRQKNFVVQRFEQHRHLCDEIIQQQRQFIDSEFGKVYSKVCLEAILNISCLVVWFTKLCVFVCVSDHSLVVPPHLQELYDMYMRELDERKLDRAVALDKVTITHTIKVTPACKIKFKKPNYTVIFKRWPK